MSQQVPGRQPHAQPVESAARQAGRHHEGPGCRPLHGFLSRRTHCLLAGLCGAAGGPVPVVNLVFALLYVADRGGIVNARPGSFADAFFFSVQTLGTLGYGVMAPRIALHQSSW